MHSSFAPEEHFFCIRMVTYSYMLTFSVQKEYSSESKSKHTEPYN